MAEDKNLEVQAKENENTHENENAHENVTTAVAEKKEAAPVYEDYEQHEIAKKPKKKFKKRFLVLGALVLLAGGYGVYSVNAAKNAVVFVSTENVSLGSIENILSISGTVQSAETKTLFSDVAAPVAEVKVKVGDKVASGDTLVVYDNDALELAKETAELAIKQAKGSYSANFTGAAAEDRKYAEGMNVTQIQDRLNQIEIELRRLNNLKDEKVARFDRTLKELNELEMDYNENGISDSAEGYKATDRTDENGNEMYLQTEKAKTEITFAKTNDPEILSWNNQITALQTEQQHLQSAKAAQLNSGQISSAKASLDSTTLTQEDTISKLEKAKEGVKADFNGVVTAVSVVEGQTAANGAQLVSLANIDDVEVSVQISKSDLPKIAIGQQVDVTINNKLYNGTISKISGTATKNSNGVAVVDTTIKVTNPDSDIILGVEANNKIHAQKADNTIVLPYEYVQTDSEGDYVFVYEDNYVVRKNVTIGIASSTQAQIVDGLSEGEQIITGGYDTLSDGMIVALNEQ